MSDWAGVLEVWTWSYYSAEANTTECTKIRISTPQNEKNSQEGALSPDTTLNWEGSPLPRVTPPVPHSHIFSALAHFETQKWKKNSQEGALSRDLGIKEAPDPTLNGEGDAPPIPHSHFGTCGIGARLASLNPNPGSVPGRRM